MNYLLDDPLIVGQFVDTLVTTHKCVDDEHYHMRFLDLIDRLKEYKSLAQDINFYGDRFYIIDDFLELGKFKVSAKGVRNFAYRLSNDNVDIYISDGDFLGSNPQVKIEYRANFLFNVGFQKAWEFGKIIASRLLGRYTSKVSRIDLASDIYGVSFDYFDNFRFRTLLTTTDREIISRFNRSKGFTFGKGDFLIRLYNKSLEIREKSNKTFFYDFWALNGFDSDSNIDVWRVEAQFRRAKIIDLFPSGLECEVTFILNNLRSLWLKFMNGFKFVNLSVSEITRVNYYMSVGNYDTSRKIYQRRYKKQDDNFDNLLQIWGNETLNLGMLKTFKNYTSDNNFYLKRTVKSVISQSFKLSGSLESLIDAFESVQKDFELENSNVVKYGLTKSFASSKEIFKALLSDKLPDYGYKIKSNSSSTLKFTKDYVNLLSLVKSENEKLKIMDDYEYYHSKVSDLVKSCVSSVMSQELAMDVIEFDGGFSISDDDYNINIPDIF